MITDRFTIHIIIITTVIPQHDIHLQVFHHEGMLHQPALHEQQSTETIQTRIRAPGKEQVNPEEILQQILTEVREIIIAEMV